MKKKIALLLAAGTVLLLTGCGKKEPPPVLWEETLPLLTEAPTYAVVLTEAPTEPSAALPTEITVPTEAATFPNAQPVAPKWDMEPGFSSREEMVYAIRSVNIRAKPSASANYKGRLPRGYGLLRVGMGSDWSAVVYNDELCYIKSEYLTTNAPADGGHNGSGGNNGNRTPVTETASSGLLYATTDVNFRYGPGADTARIGGVPKGAEVQILAVCSNGWYKVSYDGLTGYVAGGYLTSARPEGTPEPTVPPTKPETKPDTKPSTPETKPEDVTKPESKPEDVTKPETKPEDATKPETKPEDATTPESKPSDPSKPDPATCQHVWGYEGQVPAKTETHTYVKCGCGVRFDSDAGYAAHLEQVAIELDSSGLSEDEIAERFAVHLLREQISETTEIEPAKNTWKCSKCGTTKTIPITEKP